ncbi:hypothetical protein GX441_10370 [bacterium]|nr:hypothetical protein [bacterium]
MPVLTLRPNSAGTFQNWSVYGGVTHYGSTSDLNPLTGVSTSASNVKESENLADPSVTSEMGAIKSVKACMTAAKVGAGTAVVVNLWVIGGRDRDGATSWTLTTTLSNYSDELTTNPETGMDWTWSDVDDLEAGARSVGVGASTEIRVTEFWIEVDYVLNLSDSGSGADDVNVNNIYGIGDSGTSEEEVGIVGVGCVLSDTGTADEVVHPILITGDTDSGALQNEKVRTYKSLPPESESLKDILGSTTRTVEVVRVGTVSFKNEYPSKQVVRLRDMSAFYDANPPKNIEELSDMVRGKRLAAINVEMWDQISGAYLGATTTDEHGTLVLPTSKPFVEAIQWRIAGGGYSDHFSGEQAAGTPGLFFYFPCNEGKDSIIKSFPGVSGQQVTLPTGWGWYDTGFFNRPALKKVSAGQPINFYANWPLGRNSFQFLWYCSNPSTDHELLNYSSNVFSVSIKNDRLEGKVPQTTAIAGNTELETGVWYLIQITCQMGRIPFSSSAYYNLSMSVYLGGDLELTIEGSVAPEVTSEIPIVSIGGNEGDGLDELRHLSRELYNSEIIEYASFIKQGRVSGKSKGSLGTVGW